MKRYIRRGFEQRSSVPVKFGPGMVACGRALFHQPGSSLNRLLSGFYGGFTTETRLIKSLAIGD